MKNKSIILFLTVISIVCIILVLILFNYKTELENQINKKDDIITKSVERDSLLIQKTSEFAKTINHYVNNCEFSIDGKKITSSQIVDITNKAIEENNKLRDSLNYYKLFSKQQTDYYPIEYNKILSKYRDSLEKYKWQAELVKNDFGITYKITSKGNKLSAIRNSKKVDSALALFPYYKHRLSINENGNFEIETDKEYRRNIKKEEQNKQ